ncbi:MAG: hypothetical protein ACRCWO_02560 [Bosea sp. (in: a-proteobacteria)]
MMTMPDRSTGLIAACLIAIALGGCSSNPDAPTTEAKITNLIMFQSTTPPVPTQPIKPDDDLLCPSVSVKGAAIRQGGADSNSVRNQLAINDIARECTNAQAGGGFTLKIGVQGRVVLGPAGSPGTYAANLKMQVRRSGNIVANRSVRVSATVASGQGGAEFVHVEEGILVPGGSAQPVVEVWLEGGAATGGGRRR